MDSLEQARSDGFVDGLWAGVMTAICVAVVVYGLICLVGVMQ